MSGEPESFVELPQGRRLMTLARREGACHLLGADQRCSVYEARPLDCRLFPFDVKRHAGKSEVTLLALSDCDYELDGDNDPLLIEAQDGRRWRELAAYQARVASWNRAALRRRWLRRPLRSVSEYLGFLQLAAQ